MKVNLLMASAAVLTTVFGHKTQNVQKQDKKVTLGIKKLVGGTLLGGAGAGGAGLGGLAELLTGGSGGLARLGGGDKGRSKKQVQSPNGQGGKQRGAQNERQQGACGQGSPITTVTVGCDRSRDANATAGPGKAATVTHTVTAARQQVEAKTITETVVETKTVSGACAGGAQAPTIIINGGAQGVGNSGAQSAGNVVPARPAPDGNGVGVVSVPLPKTTESRASESKPTQQPKAAPPEQKADPSKAEQSKTTKSQVSESKPTAQPSVEPPQPQIEQPSAEPQPRPMTGLPKAEPAMAPPPVAATAPEGSDQPDAGTVAAPIDISGIPLSSAVNLGSLQAGQQAAPRQP